MQFSWKIVNAGLALSNPALAFSPTASAASKEDVAARPWNGRRPLAKTIPGQISGINRRK